MPKPRTNVIPIEHYVVPYALLHRRNRTLRWVMPPQIQFCCRFPSSKEELQELLHTIGPWLVIFQLELPNQTFWTVSHVH